MVTRAASGEDMRDVQTSHAPKPLGTLFAQSKVQRSCHCHIRWLSYHEPACNPVAMQDVSFMKDMLHRQSWNLTSQQFW